MRKMNSASDTEAIVALLRYLQTEIRLIDPVAAFLVALPADILDSAQLSSRRPRGGAARHSGAQGAALRRSPRM